MFDSFNRDLKLALRRLVTRPLPAIVAVLSLGFAIGANTLVFSLVNMLALRPVAGLAEPSRLVEIGRDAGGALDTIGYGDLRAIDEEVASIDGAFGASLEPVSIAHGNGEPRRALAMLVSENYFTVMGATPAAGALFAPTESAPGANPSIVLSHAAWQRWFGGDTRVVGGDVRVNGATFRLAGVLAPTFRGHIAVVAPDVYVPLSMVAAVRPRDATILEDGVWLRAGGRLAPGVSREAAEAEVAALMAVRDAARGETEPRAYKVNALRGIPGATSVALLAFMGILFALTGLVLLVACTNVASLMLARGVARRDEIAMHRVLGASRAQIVRQSLLESLVIAIAAGVVGFALTGAARGLFAWITVPVPFPVITDIAIDGRVAGFSLLLSLVTVVLFGLAPSLRVLRDVGATGLPASGRIQRTRGREWLVSVQFALSLTLLIAAGLFARALDRAADIETGLRADGVLAADIDIAALGLDGAATTAKYDAIVAAVRAQPAVRGAAFVRVVPLTLSSMTLGDVFRTPGAEAAFSPGANIVTPGYFETMGMAVRGRDFDATDVAGSEPVAVVNQRFAETWAPDGDALGATFTFGEDDETQAVRIVGIVPDGKYASLGDGHEPFVFFPQAQRDAGGMVLMTATDLPPREFEQRLSTIVAAVTPTIAAPVVDRFTDRATIGLVPQKIAGGLATALGAVGAGLAALGLYGLMVFQVTQRRREIGVRLALGADARRIGRDVLGRAARLVTWGTVGGLALGAAVATVMSSWLFGVDAGDAIAFAGATMLLVVIAGLAAWLPARRAAAVQPSTALRHD